MLVNLINISYCAMKILPCQNEHFSEYRTKSVQEFRFELSQGIRSQIFFATFVKNIETHIKSNAMTKALKQLIHQQVYHLLSCKPVYNKSKNRNVLDVRASLKVGLQMEQGKLPSH